MDHIKFTNNKHRRGSALILVVVLTALLAVIGTIFLLSSRVESMSTSGIAENKALESAIDDIIGKIRSSLNTGIAIRYAWGRRQPYSRNIPFLRPAERTELYSFHSGAFPL